MVTARLPSLPRLLPPHSHTQWLFLTYRADSQAGSHSLCSGEVGGTPCPLSPNSVLKDAILPQAAFCLLTA